MFSEAKIRALRARDPLELIETRECCRVLGINPARWYRISQRHRFPHRYKWRHGLAVKCGELADFLDLTNHIDSGLTLSGVARHLHMAYYIVVAFYDAGELPTPIGFARGSPRWTIATIDEWHHKRLDGAKLPARLLDPEPRP